jgi:hypothetical protein
MSKNIKRNRIDSEYKITQKQSYQKNFGKWIELRQSPESFQILGFYSGDIDVEVLLKG